jgi:Leucine-rich repeat (LRR) protein
LGYNEIFDLPENFGNLKNLQKFYFQGNWPSSLPESFGNLTALTHLNLNHVPLQSLPKSMSNLSNLKFLWILRDKFYDPLPEEDLLPLKQQGCTIFR